MVASELTHEERRILEVLDGIAGPHGRATIEDVAGRTGLEPDYVRALLLSLADGAYVVDDRDPRHVSSPHFRLADKGRVLLHPLEDSEKGEVASEPGSMEGAEPGGGMDASRDRTPGDT